MNDVKYVQNRFWRATTIFSHKVELVIELTRAIVLKKKKKKADEKKSRNLLCYRKKSEVSLDAILNRNKIIAEGHAIFLLGNMVLEYLVMKKMVFFFFHYSRGIQKIKKDTWVHEWLWNG